jgi:hypothetical protein
MDKPRMVFTASWSRSLVAAIDLSLRARAAGSRRRIYQLPARNTTAGTSPSTHAEYAADGRNVRRVIFGYFPGGLRFAVAYCRGQGRSQWSCATDARRVK